MQLLTQSELAVYLGLSRQRVSQLVKQSVFHYYDSESLLIDRDYAAFRYQLYKKKLIKDIFDDILSREKKNADEVVARILKDLPPRLNTLFDDVVPDVLTMAVEDWECSPAEIAVVKDGLTMFYSAFLEMLTGASLSLDDPDKNPRLINEFWDAGSFKNK